MRISDWSSDVCSSDLFDVAMSRDASLLADVTDFVLGLRGLDAAGAISAARVILFKWAGVGDVDPASRGLSFDAREVAIVEKLTGQTYPATLNENVGFGAGIRTYFETFFNGYLTRLVGQVWGSALVLKLENDPHAADTADVYLSTAIFLAADAIQAGRTLYTDLARKIVSGGAALKR